MRQSGTNLTSAAASPNGEFNRELPFAIVPKKNGDQDGRGISIRMKKCGNPNRSLTAFTPSGEQSAGLTLNNGKADHLRMVSCVAIARTIEALTADGLLPDPIGSRRKTHVPAARATSTHLTSPIPFHRQETIVHRYDVP